MNNGIKFKLYNEKRYRQLEKTKAYSARETNTVPKAK